MISLKGTLNVIDNSGALLVECVNVLKHKVNHGYGTVGDEIVCVVKRTRASGSSSPGSLSGSTGGSSGGGGFSGARVKRGDVRRAVIVRVKKPASARPDGLCVRFDDNACVLLNSKREMLGTRISGPVSAELRRKGWGKIISLAPRAI